VNCPVVAGPSAQFNLTEGFTINCGRVTLDPFARRSNIRLVSLEQYLPTLDPIIKNETYMHKARVRVSEIAELIRGGKPAQYWALLRTPSYVGSSPGVLSVGAIAQVDHFRIADPLGEAGPARNILKHCHRHPNDVAKTTPNLGSCKEWKTVSSKSIANVVPYKITGQMGFGLGAPKTA